MTHDTTTDPLGIGANLAALPSALGHFVDRGCVIAIFYDAGADAGSSSKSSSSPRLRGLAPYMLDLDSIDPDTVSHNAIIDARSQALRVLADAGFDVMGANSASKQAKSVFDSDIALIPSDGLFDKIYHLIVVVDPVEFAKTKDNTTNLYKLYDRFSRESSAITSTTPAIIAVTNSLRSNHQFYALNRLNNVEVFDGVIGDIDHHPSTLHYRVKHNRELPHDETMAVEQYDLASSTNATALALQPYAQYVAEYVVTEHDRIVDAVDAQFTASQDVANNAINRRLIHRLRELSTTAQALITLNGQHSHIPGADLRVVAEKLAFLFSYTNPDSVYFDIYSESVTVPLTLTTLNKGVPAALHDIFGSAEAQRVIRIALEALVSLDFTQTALPADTAYMIRANALRVLLTQSTVEGDYNTYRRLAAALDAHLGPSDTDCDTSHDTDHVESINDNTRDMTINPGGMYIIARVNEKITDLFIKDLVAYHGNNTAAAKDTDDLILTDDIAAEVAALAGSNSDKSEHKPEH